jgi:hypothetical protein
MVGTRRLEKKHLEDYVFKYHRNPRVKDRYSIKDVKNLKKLFCTKLNRDQTGDYNHAHNKVAGRADGSGRCAR